MVRSRLDRDGGIAYLAESIGGEPLEEEILGSSPLLSSGKLMVEYEQLSSS